MHNHELDSCSYFLVHILMTISNVTFVLCAYSTYSLPIKMSTLYTCEIFENSGSEML